MLAKPIKLQDYIETDPEKLGGVPIFRHTRVPVRYLFDYLREGVPLEVFLEEFEGVSREQAEALLEFAEQEIVEQAQRT